MMKAVKHLYEFGPFRLDPAERRLLCDDKPLALTPKCFDLLVVLVENSGHLLEKEELLGRIWPDQFVEESNLSFNISALRKLLEDGRNGRRYIETVPKKGFRFVAHVEKLPGDGLVPTADETSRELTIERDEETKMPDRQSSAVNGEALPANSKAALRQPLSLKIIALVLAASVLGLIAYALWPKRAVAPAPQPLKTIAVLPFKPLNADSRNESLEMGMAETLITRLSNLNQIVVRPISAVRKYTDAQADAVKIGQELQTDAVLDGSIQKVGDRVRVTVRLTNVSTGAPVWAQQFDENFSDIFKVQDSIAERVVNALPEKLSGEEQRRLTKRYTDDAEAYELYLQAQYLWDNRNLGDQKKAEFYYRQALEKDPQFALAHVGLAELEMSRIGATQLTASEGAPEIIASLKQALELDDTLAEAHNLLAEVKYQFDFDWAAAETEFRKAIELNPNVASIHLAYGCYLMSLGRFDEATREMERAQELDPRSTRINRARGRLLYYSRQYDRSIEHFRRMIEAEPQVFVNHWSLARTYARKGMYAEMVEEDAEAARVQRASAAEIDAYIQLFKTSGLRALLRKQVDSLSKGWTKGDHTSPLSIATLYTMLGERDQAFVWIGKGIDERSSGVAQLKVEPTFDDLRSDPRFTKLLQRINLTP